MRNWKKIVASAFALFALADLPAHASAIGEIEQRPSSKATYMATSGGTTLAASATDFATLTGSASKTIRVIKILMQPTCTSTGTAAAWQRYCLIKRSTADSGGTATTMTNVPLDSNNAAGTATAKIYTANPAGLGTAVGTLLDVMLTGVNDTYIYGANTMPHENLGYCLFNASTNPHGQAIVLRGTSEQICINLNGVTQGGTTPVMRVTFYWTEE